MLESVTKYQPTCRYSFQMHLPQKLLKMCRQINDLNTLKLAIKKLTQRHAATPAFIDRDHNFIDSILLDNFRQGFSIGNNIQARGHWCTFLRATKMPNQLYARIIFHERFSDHTGT